MDVELVDIRFADGRSIAELDGLLKERMQWLGQSAQQGIIAASMNTLVSLRATTKVAKVKKRDIEVEMDDTLIPSFAAKRICVRDRATKHHLAGVRVATTIGGNLFKDAHVYKWVDKFTSQANSIYYIIALSEKAAKVKAFDILQRKVKAYAGLARLAFSTLLMKTGTGGIGSAPALQQKTAMETTVSREHKTPDGYQLHLEDDLNYAVNALKGGYSDVENSMKKALNKTVATINQKIPDGATWFGRGKIPLPFPEVRKR